MKKFFTIIFAMVVTIFIPLVCASDYSTIPFCLFLGKVINKQKVPISFVELAKNQESILAPNSQTSFKTKIEPSALTDTHEKAQWCIKDDTSNEKSTLYIHVGTTQLTGKEASRALVITWDHKEKIVQSSKTYPLAESDSSITLDLTVNLQAIHTKPYYLDNVVCSTVISS